jgi:hypothetical protein
MGKERIGLDRTRLRRVWREFELPQRAPVPEICAAETGQKLNTLEQLAP